MVPGECDLFHQQRGGLLYDLCYTALQRVNTMSSTCLQKDPQEAQSGEGGGARRICFWPKASSTMGLTFYDP